MSPEFDASHAPAVLITGYFGYGNLGDEALLSATVAGLQQRIDGVHIKVISGDPAETSRLHGVEAISSGPSAVLHAFQHTDVVALGPGGIFHDARLPGSRRRQGGLSFFYALALAAQDAGIPLALFNVGIGPVESLSADRFTRRIVEAASFVNVRDEHSERWISSRVTSDVMRSADLAWLYRPREPVVASGSGRGYVAVSVRQWPGHPSGRGVHHELAGALRTFLQRHPDLDARIVPMQFRGSHSDVPVAEKLASVVGMDRASLHTVSTPADAYRLFTEADCAVAMRLHAGVFAINAGVPTVGLTYTQKVASPYASVGYPNLALPMEATTDEIERALVVAGKWDRHGVESAVVANRDSAGEAADRLATFVMGSPPRPMRSQSSIRRWWIRRQAARVSVVGGRASPRTSGGLAPGGYAPSP